MRCRICGAKLTKENADICLNCYKAYQEDEDLKNDVTERLVVKRRYKINYILIKYVEWICILILAVCGCIVGGNYLSAVLCGLLSIAIIILALAMSKAVARNTKAVFYDKKVVYTSKSWFMNNEKTVKYSNLTDISVFQTFRQKRMGFGDICVYARGSVPGTTLLNGFQIKDVENVAQVMEQIKEVTNFTENKK